MYHRGYYNQKSNQIFTQAQLFCAPFNSTDVLQLPQSLMKGQSKQVTQGCLDKSTLSELRDDLINNWEILYSNPEYQLCKKHSGVPVDRESNRQIYKKYFNQVPLLKNLVDTFETMLPYLSINLVWLLHKSKEGDGFQGWYKDFYMGGWITKTIVINVGSKVINNEETSTSLENNDFLEVDQWKERNML